MELSANVGINRRVIYEQRSDENGARCAVNSA
jgi:hypothetical protein